MVQKYIQPAGGPSGILSPAVLTAAHAAGLAVGATVALAAGRASGISAVVVARIAVGLAAACLGLRVLYRDVPRGLPWRLPWPLLRYSFRGMSVVLAAVAVRRCVVACRGSAYGMSRQCPQYATKMSNHVRGSQHCLVLF